MRSMHDAGAILNGLLLVRNSNAESV